jgi:GntR family transcriptional regulator
MSDKLNIQKKVPRHPFQMLQNELAKMIAKTPDGGRLPPEPELARMLGVSRATLREGMRSFEGCRNVRRTSGQGYREWT